ncbi:hypothetical protein QM565_22280 [Geitlerinema splendidum]|nr:hypothetical protein [Geitlerinema splendidum]
MQKHHKDKVATCSFSYTPYEFEYIFQAKVDLQKSFFMLLCMVIKREIKMDIKARTRTAVLILLMTSPAVMGMDELDSEKLRPPKVIVSSPASSSTSHDLLSATPLIRCIPGLWEEALKRGVTEDIVVVKNGKFITVLSDNRELYTCQLTSKRFKVAPGERIKVTYNITADAEVIALNFLNSKRDNWYWEINPFLLKKGKHSGTLKAVVPQGESETSLIFYNNRASTASTQFTIHDLKIEVHPPFTSTPATTRFSRLIRGVFDASPEPSLVPPPASSSISDPLSATPLSKIVQVSLEKALKTEVTEGAVVAKSGRIVTVLSDNRTLHTHQVKTNEFDVVPGERIKVTYVITADAKETIALDFLNSEGDNYYRETNPVFLKKGKQTGTFEAIVPEGESKTSLIFYNNCVTPSPTQFTIHSLKIEIFPQ